MRARASKRSRRVYAFSWTLSALGCPPPPTSVVDPPLQGAPDHTVDTMSLQYRLHHTPLTKAGGRVLLYTDLHSHRLNPRQKSEIFQLRNPTPTAGMRYAAVAPRAGSVGGATL